MATSLLHRAVGNNVVGAAYIRQRIPAGYFRRKHLRHGFLYLLYAALIAIGVKIIAVLWLYFSWSPERKAIEVPAAPQATAFDAQRWQIIDEQNWFGQYQPTPPPHTAQVAETRLNVVLRGIAYGAGPAAVIEEGGQQSMYREGDALADYPATVGEIFPDHLLLYYQGETERLSLADSEASHHRQAPADAEGASVEHL